MLAPGLIKKSYLVLDVTSGITTLILYFPLLGIVWFLSSLTVEVKVVVLKL